MENAKEEGMAGGPLPSYHWRIRKPLMILDRRISLPVPFARFEPYLGSGLLGSLFVSRCCHHKPAFLE